MRCLKEKRSGSGGSWRKTSRFQLNQKKHLSARPWARWTNNFRHLRRIWRRIISRKGKCQRSLETLQSRRTTGMPLWNISLQSLGFGTWKRPRKMPPSISSYSRARWVQDGKTKMREDGAGFDWQRYHAYDHHLTWTFKELVLCSWWNIEPRDGWVHLWPENSASDPQTTGGHTSS